MTAQEPRAPKAPPAREFDLFLSYARRDAVRRFGSRERDVVAALKRILEAHRHPVDHHRFRVCTDAEDFELNSLCAEIGKRLDASAALGVLCTPTADRPTIRCEIALFKAKHEGRQIVWIGAGRLPSELFGEMAGDDPIAADLNVPKGATFRTWKRAARAESHRIVAKAWGIELQSVRDRFKVHRYKQLWIRLAIAFGTATLLLGIAVLLNIRLELVGTIIHTLETPQNAGLVRAPEPTGPFFAIGGGAINRCTRASCNKIANQYPVVGPACATPGLVHVGEGTELVSRDYSGAIKHRRPAPNYIEQVACRGDSIAVESSGDLFMGLGNTALQRVMRPMVPRPPSAPTTFPARYPVRFGHELAWTEDATMLATSDGGGVVIVDATTRQIPDPNVFAFPQPGVTLAKTLLTYEPDARGFVWQRGVGELQRLRRGSHEPELVPAPLPANLRRLQPDETGRRILAVGDSEIRILRRSSPGYALDERYRLPGSAACLDAIWLDSNSVGYVSSEGKIVVLSPAVTLFGERLWWAASWTRLSRMIPARNPGP